MSDLIDRQAAIDALHTWFKDGFDEDKWWNSTHVLAAIEGLPPAQPIEDIHREKEQAYYCGYEDGAKAVRKEQRTGKWIKGHCSECGDHAPYWAMSSAYYGSKFCPNCGMKMTEGDAE